LQLYSDWAGELIAVKDWPRASQVLAEGLRALPDDYGLKRNAAYVVQEWVGEGLAKRGAPGFRAAADAAKGAFPDLPEVGEALGGVLGRELERIIGEGRAQDGLLLLAECSSKLDAEVLVKLKEFIYERWTRAEADDNKLAEAVRIYDLGLADIPQSALLQQNRDYFASKLP